MVVVVIPVKNEEDTIADAVYILPDWVTVVVVDGGSTDCTFEVAKNAGADYVVCQVGSGYGGGVLTGLSMALHVEGVERIVVMDAGSHNFSEIMPYLGVGADILAGRRDKENKPFVRKVLTKVAKLVCKTPVRDPSNGFRAYSPAAARAILAAFSDKDTPSYAFNMAVAVHPSVVDETWSVVNFPMTYTPGKSGLSLKGVAKAGLWAVRHLWSR